jgi:hypothetical protein
VLRAGPHPRLFYLLRVGVPEDDRDDTGDHGSAVELTGWPRWLAGASGAGLTGAGVLAVFSTTNQAGTAALLAMGGFLFGLALIGRIPERGSVGGANWEYLPIRRLLRSEIPEVRRSAANAVLSDPDTRRAAPARIRNRARAVVREADAVDQLVHYMRTAYPDIVIRREAPFEDAPVGTIRPDLAVESPAREGTPGWRFPIEVKPRFTPQAGNQVAWFANQEGSAVAVLALLNEDEHFSEVGEKVIGAVTIFIARASPDDNYAHFRDAVDRAISRSLSQR